MDNVCMDWDSHRAGHQGGPETPVAMATKADTIDAIVPI